jgi:hypothetical protein
LDLGNKQPIDRHNRWIVHATVQSKKKKERKKNAARAEQYGLTPSRKGIINFNGFTSI